MDAAVAPAVGSAWPAAGPARGSPAGPAGVRCPGSPFLLDQTPVPGEQGARRHDWLYPKVPGQQPRQGGYHHPVSPIRFRAGDLAARDRDLACRSNKISAFLETSLRARSASQPNNRTMSRKTTRKSTGAEGGSPGQMLRTSYSTPQVQALDCDDAVDVEEVGGEHCRCVRMQELLPCRVGMPLRCRRDFQCREDLADRGSVDPVAELD